jgi:hypothetical protein
MFFDGCTAGPSKEASVQQHLTATKDVVGLTKLALTSNHAAAFAALAYFSLQALPETPLCSSATSSS